MAVVRRTHSYRATPTRESVKVLGLETGTERHRPHGRLLGAFVNMAAGQAALVEARMDKLRVKHVRGFGNAVLIGGESGLILATAAPGR